MSNRRSRYQARRRCSGIAALEVVMTTALTFFIFGFATFWMIRISRVLFSLIGEMVGSPVL